MTVVNNANLISAQNYAAQQIQSVQKRAEKLPRQADPELVQKANQFVNQIFWGTLLREFRDAHKNPILDNGPGSQTFVRQLDQMIIERISQRGKSPLTDALLKQLDPRGFNAGNYKNNHVAKSVSQAAPINPATTTNQETVSNG